MKIWSKILLVMSILPGVALAAELAGTVSDVDTAASTAKVRLTDDALPAVGDPVSITWTVGGELIDVAKGSVIRVEGDRVEVRFTATGGQVSPGMEVKISSSRPAGAPTRREIDAKGSAAKGGPSATPPEIRTEDVTLRAVHGAAPGGEASIEGGRLQIGTSPNGWHARPLSRMHVPWDFEVTATLRLLEEFDPDAVAGLSFDSSSGRDEVLAVGAVFVGKSASQVVVSRKTESGEWVGLLSAPRGADGRQEDRFVLRRRGQRFEFLLDGELLAAWQAPTVVRGAPKFYVYRGRAELRDWKVTATGVSPP